MYPNEYKWGGREEGLKFSFGSKWHEDWKSCLEYFKNSKNKPENIIVTVPTEDAKKYVEAQLKKANIKVKEIEIKK